MPATTLIGEKMFETPSSPVSPTTRICSTSKYGDDWRPDLSDLNSLEPDLSEPELFEPGPPGLVEDPGLLDAMTEEERQ